MAKSLLYKEEKDIIYSVEAKSQPDGRLTLLFSCDGGKHGTDEILAEYTLSAKQLLDILTKDVEG